MKKLLSLILVITLSAGFFTGCKKDKGDPPTLPPLGTMKIDFSEFTDSKKSAEITGIENSIKGVENGNFLYAASVAGFWNLILTLNLAIPVASFSESFNHTPAYLDNRTWQWAYSVNVLAGTYKARLTGQIRDNDVKWEMYISKEGIGAFAEVLWFEGTSDLDGTNGQWILNNKTDSALEPLLQIDWTLENEAVASVKYTYIKEDISYGSYIEYGLQSSILNAFYNIHIYESVYTQSFVDIFIEWSTTNHNGHVKAYYKYTDQAWHCWNSNGNDVVCN